MQVQNIIETLENHAPLALQEEYDNSGLLLGSMSQVIQGVLVCLEITEEVVDEAIEHNLGLIVSHHPLIFKGLKKITGSNDSERAIIKAIKNNIAVYACHTNIDQVLGGVSDKIADKIGLIHREILAPLPQQLVKLITFVPHEYAEKVRNALFSLGAGHIGNYHSCSFNVEGYGTFQGTAMASPFVGEKEKLHQEPETRIEVLIPKHAVNLIVSTLKEAHPYEEPAYDLIPLGNEWHQAGFGMIGRLEKPEETTAFLQRIKKCFDASSIRHTRITKQQVQRIAFCGGAGSDLLPFAKQKEADVFISADFKYHEFFNATPHTLIVDLGHYEMEQYTKEVFYEIIRKKFPTFAVRISGINTNPIQYI